MAFTQDQLNQYYLDAANKGTSQDDMRKWAQQSGVSDDQFNAARQNYANIGYQTDLNAKGMTPAQIQQQANQLGYGDVFNQAQNTALQNGMAAWSAQGLGRQDLYNKGIAAGFTPDQLNSVLGTYGQAPQTQATSASGVNYSSPYGSALQNQLSGTDNNPYMQQMADAITQNATNNFQNNILPGLRGQAEMTGQYGGSRQGIAEGLATKSFNQDLMNQLSNLYGSSYESAQNRQGQAALNLAGLDNQTGIANAGFANQANIADMQSQQAQNALDLQRQLGMANIGLQQQGLGLQQQGLDWQKQYGQGQLALGQGNLALGQQNLALNQQNSNNNWAVQGAQLANQNAMLPYQQLMALYGIGNDISNTDWNNLSHFASSIYPGMGAGSGSTSTNSQNPGFLGIANGLMPIFSNLFGGSGGSGITSGSQFGSIPSDAYG